MASGAVGLCVVIHDASSLPSSSESLFLCIKDDGRGLFVTGRREFFLRTPEVTSGPVHADGSMPHHSSWPVQPSKPGGSSWSVTCSTRNECDSRLWSWCRRSRGEQSAAWATWADMARQLVEIVQTCRQWTPRTPGVEVIVSRTWRTSTSEGACSMRTETVRFRRR